MKSINTNFAARWPAVPNPSPTRRRRGTAEVELLLVIPVLLSILFLAGAALKLGATRLSNSYAAELDVYSQVVVGRNIVPSDCAIVSELSNARPGLTLRSDVSHQEQNVVFSFGRIGLNPVHISDSSFFVDPNWQFSAWPHSADQADTQSWFTAYVDESHPPALVYSLGLQPPWRP